MPRSPLVSTAWPQLVLGVAAMWLFLAGAVVLFTWPVARSAPRDLAVGVVAPAPRAAEITGRLSASRPGAYEPRLLGDEGAARDAIARREVDGAYVLTADELHVVTAGAAGATVASLITAEGEALGAQLGVRVVVSDAVPYAAADPKGSVFSILLLPLTVCSVTVAMVIALVAAKMRAWWELVALVAVAAGGGLAAYGIAQTWLGALPHHPATTWAAMALMILSISATASGLIALLGTAGTAVAAALLIFVGNSFAGSQSSPDLLPPAAEAIGRLLPPGAGAGLLRSTTYFDGHGSWTQLVVLLCWVAVGSGAVVIGHQRAARAQPA